MTPWLLNKAFLAKITIIKVFPCRGQHDVPIFRGLDARRGGRKLRTDTRDNYSNPRCAHARRGLINLAREHNVECNLKLFMISQAPLLTKSTGVRVYFGHLQ